MTASSYVASVCPASARLASAVSAQDQQIRTKLPSLLGATATGGSSVMEQAKKLLLTFDDKSTAAAKTWQQAIRAAGTPQVENGSSVAAALNGAAGKLVAAFDTFRSETNALPTTDPTAFTQAAQAALSKFQSSITSASSALKSLSNTEIDAAAKKTAACDGIISG